MIFIEGLVYIDITPKFKIILNGGYQLVFLIKEASVNFRQYVKQYPIDCFFIKASINTFRSWVRVLLSAFNFVCESLTATIKCLLR